MHQWDSIDDCRELENAIKGLQGHWDSMCRDLGDAAWNRYSNGGFTKEDSHNRFPNWYVLGWVVDPEEDMIETTENTHAGAFEGLYWTIRRVAHEELHHKGYGDSYHDWINEIAEGCAPEI